jgi:hypothetical protein
MTYRSPLLSILLLTAMASQSIAAPAAFYQWRSKIDGQVICSQTSLGPGWERAAGPFRDSHCGKRMIVK